MALPNVNELSSSQRRLVEGDQAGDVLLRAPAGTGKTTVAVHRALHLAREVVDDPDDRVLLTAFTMPRVKALEGEVRRLDGEAARHIDVTNIQPWALTYLKAAAGEAPVVASGPRIRELWSRVFSEMGELEFPRSFYLGEWEQIVRPADIVARTGYLKARRDGRGVLDRGQRLRVWDVLSRFRGLLDEDGKVEWADVMRDARLRLESDTAVRRYRAVVCDDVQDFRPWELRFLRALGRGGESAFFLAGDPCQRLFGFPTSLSEAGWDFGHRVFELDHDHRGAPAVTAWTRRLAAEAGWDDLLGGRYEPSPGPADAGPLEVLELADEAAEERAIVERLRAWCAAGAAESCAVVARTQARLDERYRPLLERAGIAVANPGADGAAAGVSLVPMARMADVEPDRVLIAGLDAASFPAPSDEPFPDAWSEAAHRRKECALLYIAATRARREVVVTAVGKAAGLPA